MVNLTVSGKKRKHEIAESKGNCNRKSIRDRKIMTIQRELDQLNNPQQS